MEKVNFVDGAPDRIVTGALAVSGMAGAGLVLIGDIEPTSRFVVAYLLFAIGWICSTLMGKRN